MFGRNSKRRAADEAEAAHDAQLAQAEVDLMHLEARSENAVRTLNARNPRDHWREAIEDLIQGGY